MHLSIRRDVLKVFLKGSDPRSEFNRRQKLIASDRRSGSDRRSL